jgi:hypothetical protein
MLSGPVYIIIGNWGDSTGLILPLPRPGHERGDAHLEIEKRFFGAWREGRVGRQMTFLILPYVR